MSRQLVRVYWLDLACVNDLFVSHMTVHPRAALVRPWSSVFCDDHWWSVIDGHSSKCFLRENVTFEYASPAGHRAMLLEPFSAIMQSGLTWRHVGSATAFFDVACEFFYVVLDTYFRIFRLLGSTTYTDAACCYRPNSVVCRSVTLVSPAKTVEPIEMLFGLWTRVGEMA